MPIYFQRPENALKRANEFIDVGEKQWALNALYDVIKSRKHRTWQKIHEPIMCKYLELCVDLKKSHVAKEGLFQYRNICQQVNIKSLEDVVRGYLQLAEQKTDAAREESQQAIEVDDLDQMQTPEGILLSAVSSEDTQDRTDRVVLTPWVKFLWESYRQCLELLRNNSRVERLYHDIAQHAFKFCLKYTRKTEFRKLCDNLRAHLGHIHKHQNQQTSVNLNNPESHAMHLETRLVQLDSAIQMELWQEAYKAIEDIYGLMNLSKKAPNPRLMANYYQKLSLVFWKSNNYLFHSAALFRLFHLSREQKKNITSDEVTKLAARVVLATLAIPMTPNRTEIDRLVETDENVIDKNHRLLSTLLGLANVPTRASLIKDMVRFGIIQCAPVQLQELYCWLEIDFHPLKLCTRVQQTIKFLYEWEEFPDLQQYIPSIQSITVVRLIREISQVYQTIKFSRVLELAPFIKSFNLEYLVVEIARRNDLQVRIDHKQQSFHFGSELNISLREEVIEGPYLQSMPSDQLRRHLVARQNALSAAAAIIQPNKVKAETKDLRKDILKAYNLNSSKDHLRILSRQQIIEERKELLENLNYQKEVEERKLIEDKQQKLRDAEKERMARETEERNKQRLLKEQTEMKRKVVMEKIEQLKKTDIGSRIFEGMDEDELQNLDPDDLLNKQVEQIDREKKELQMKLRNQERKIDHLERAKRQEEIPMLLAQYEEVRKVDMEFWEEYERERIKSIYDEREIAIRERKRLLRIKEDKDKFLHRLQEARSSVYEEKMAEFSKLLEEERKKRFAERKRQRREDRRETWYREQEEKKQRLIEEQQKREREEELAKLEEIEAQKRAKLEEIEAKKRAKEKEIEERLKREQEAASEKKRDEDKKFPKEKGRDSESSQKMTSWREREQEKKQSWVPQEKSDQDREADKDDKGRDWRKKDESRRSEDKEANDGWRRRDKTSEEDRNDRSWKKEDSRSSYASSQRSFSGWRDRDPDRSKREVENTGSRRFEDRDRESNYSSSREQNRESDFPQKSSSGWRDRDQEKRPNWAPRDRTERDPESNNEDKSRDWRRRDEPRKIDDREPPRNEPWKREPRKLDDRERDMPRGDAWRRRDNQEPRKDERDFPKSDAWKTRDNPETRKDERNFPRSDAWKRDSQETRKDDRDYPRSGAWRSTESSKEGGAWRRDDNKSQSSAYKKT